MFISYNLKQSDSLSPEHLINPGLNYGDGFFETLLTDNEHVKHLPEHLSRLRSGIKVLGLTLEYSNEQISSHISTIINSDSGTGLLKIFAWRKNAIAFKPMGNASDIVISWTQRTHKMSPTVDANLYQSKHFFESEVSHYKSLSSMRYVLAGVFCKNNNLDTCIILNTDLNITETLTANIFWITDDVIYTPSLQTGCIAGIMRNEVLKLLDVKEGLFSTKELLNASCVFSTNSGGIQYIKTIDNSAFSTYHPLVEELKLELY